MTPAQVRPSLKAPLAGLGFRKDGSRFVCDLPELVHHVDVTAVRRLAGCVQIHHRVATKEQPPLSVEQEVASYGLGSAYPRIWSSAAVDGALVLEQVSAVCRVFRCRSDLAHFTSEGDSPSTEVGRPDATPIDRARALSRTEAARVLEQLATETLGQAFSRVPRFNRFALWSSHAETEGYRHLAYMDANETRTLAHVVLLALPSNVVAGSLRSDDGMRRLMTAPKSVLYSAGRPVLLPMQEGCSGSIASARAALPGYMSEHPPHRLPG